MKATTHPACPVCDGNGYTEKYTFNPFTSMDEVGPTQPCDICGGGGYIDPEHLYECQTALCGVIVDGATLLRMAAESVRCLCARSIHNYIPMDQEDYPDPDDCEAVWTYDEIKSYQKEL